MNKTGDRHPLVSILILNHNGKKFLEDCYKTVLASTYHNFEVILVDNASTDDSVAFTQKNFPEVKVFETSSNSGYSRGYNLSFREAKGKYYLLLNNDVTVDPGWLEPLVETAEQNPSVAALQPKLVSMLDPKDFEYAGASGGFMDIYGFPFLRGRVFTHMEKDHGQYDDVTQVFWTTGAAMFVRADALKTAGLLDEDFVHHMEEIDLCWRLNLAGYKLMVVPRSRVLHYGGATITTDSFRKIYWNHRNSIFMMLKNLGNKYLPKLIFRRWLLELLAIAQSLAKLDLKRTTAIIKGHLWLLFHWKLVRQKRREVQKMRKVSDEKLFRLLLPNSLALQYFLKGKKTYRELMGNGP